MLIKRVAASRESPRYTFAPIRQCGASEAGNAAIGRNALKRYEKRVPVAKRTVRT